MIAHGPPRAAIVRGAGVTPSERYLASLAETSFLNLWSYPNVFIDKKTGGSGDGKELCDLLVVCGDHILIFSDKAVSWPADCDIQVAWSRWYKRAILKSVNQIRGAERWITTFPQRIFLDPQCSQPLPLSLPLPERRKIHGIVVALGAGEACKKYFDDEIGSLFLAPAIEGEAHWNGHQLLPFVVGDVDPEGSFVHVLNDATLDIVMRKLDTITDFTTYLQKKEDLIRSRRLLSAAGEEELVAYYMTHMSPAGEHDFTTPDGSYLTENEKISIGLGFYADLLRNEQYRAKKAFDEVSYVWDRLIQAFTTHMLAGTTIVPSGQAFDIMEHEESVRHMALVPRYLRRSLGAGILDALEKGRTTDRFTRGFLPGPDENGRDIGFFFMTLAVPKFELKEGYEQYRRVRRNMLETYALAMLRGNPRLRRVVGIATEPPPTEKGHGSSEDLILAEQPEWTPELEGKLRERQEAFNIFESGNYREYAIREDEFPNVPESPSSSEESKLTRRKGGRKRRRRDGNSGGPRSGSDEPVVSSWRRGPSIEVWR